MGHTVEQLSIFLENKIGSLNEIMEILSKADIRIIAATIADTTEYGILRLITTDTAKAHDLLRSAQKNCNRTEVIALSCESTAGGFYNQLKSLSQEGVVIEYMYCFSIRDKAFLILRVNDNEKAIAAIGQYNLTLLRNDELISL